MSRQVTVIGLAALASVVTACSAGDNDQDDSAVPSETRAAMVDPSQFPPCFARTRGLAAQSPWFGDAAWDRAGTLPLWFKGPAPENVREAAATCPRGARVHFIRSPYTRRELIRESNRIFRQRDVHGVQLLPHASGLRVWGFTKRFESHDLARTLGSTYAVVGKQGRQVLPATGG